MIIVILCSISVLIITSSANELALQVVNVALSVKEVFLVVALDLNAAQSLLGQVLWVVNIDHIVVFIFFSCGVLIVHTIFHILSMGARVSLQSCKLALSQILNVDLTV